MKIIYQGTRYDTETGTVVQERKTVLRDTHPCHVQYTIYQTRGGKKFIHGRGGALTLFRGGERIIPMTDELEKALVKPS